MLTVGANAARVEDRLARGELACPGCGGVAGAVGVGPGAGAAGGGAVRCGRGGLAAAGCGVACASAGVRAVAAGGSGDGDRGGAGGEGGRGGCPDGRGGGGAAGGDGARLAAPVRWAGGAVRVVFTALLVEVGVDPVPPAAAPSVFADAVAAVAGACVAVASRWPDVGEVPPWLLAARCPAAVCWPRAGLDRPRNTSCLSRCRSWPGSFAGLSTQDPKEVPAADAEGRR